MKALVFSLTAIIVVGSAYAQSATPANPTTMGGNTKPTAIGGNTDPTSISGGTNPTSISGNASASEGSNQAVATPHANAGMPAKGANSFTMSEARDHIVDNGFTNVTGLTKDADGVWHGRADRDGMNVTVWLDYKGHVGTN